MQQLATPDAQTHTTLPPPPPTTASTHSSQLQAQQALEGKVRTLERELYYYKKTCRDLKKRLRVTGGSTSTSRSASSSRTATSCRPSRVHKRDSTSKTPSGSASASASGTVEEVDESQTSHDRSRGARSMSDVNSMEGERIPLVTRALEGAVDSELSHNHRLETEEANTSLNDSLDGGSGPPQKPGSFRETSETAGSGSASAGQSARPQQQGSDRREHNVGSGGAVNAGVVSVGGGSSAETKVLVEVVRKSKRQLRQLRSVHYNTSLS